MTPLPIFKDYEVPEGDSFAFTVSDLKDKSGVAVVSLTGWDFVFTIKAKYAAADSAALVVKETAAMTINPSTLVVGVELSASDMQAVPIGVDVYHCMKARAPDGFVGTISEGIIFKSYSARRQF